jgi:hypothetical protein
MALLLVHRPAPHFGLLPLYPGGCDQLSWDDYSRTILEHFKCVMLKLEEGFCELRYGAIKLLEVGLLYCAAQ